MYTIILVCSLLVGRHMMNEEYWILESFFHKREWVSCFQPNNYSLNPNNKV